MCSLAASSCDGNRGHGRFNIYIHEYCLVHGFTRSALELMSEAKLNPHAQPPINANEGLLFE